MLEIMFFYTFRLPLLCKIYNRKFKKFREIAGFIPNPLRFHKKTEIRFWEAENLLKPEPERIEAFRNTVQCNWKQRYCTLTAKICSVNMESYPQINSCTHIRGNNPPKSFPFLTARDTYNTCITFTFLSYFLHPRTTDTQA